MPIDEIHIGDRRIGPNHPPFVVAELSANHNGSLEKALGIVEAAARAGAHAVKLQTYTADTMTLDSNGGDFLITHPASPWRGKTLHALYQEAHTPWEWHRPIMDRCRELGMIVFSTPFDETSVEFLERLDVPCFKIASFELTDLPLIRRVATTKKPMILSTGMANIAEIGEAVSAARSAGCKDLILLKCTSTYPAEPFDTHLNTLPHMRALFQCPVGLSDHTLGTGVAAAAVALGAVMIEKHLALSRQDGGVDSVFSTEPHELRTLVSETERAWKALGTVRFGPTDGEMSSLALRRSLYVVEDISPGDPLTAQNMRSIRPGGGLPPKYYEALLGKRVRRPLARGTPLSWDVIG